MKLSDFINTDLPVLLVGMHKNVEGATRLQKYAFLSAMQIKNIDKIGFYNDWQAGHYGPFSIDLAQAIALAIQKGHIKRIQVTNVYGFQVDRFAVTEKGKAVLHNLKNKYPDFYNKILKITQEYQKLSLFRLLQYVYYRYPKYAANSVIKDKIGKNIYESDSYLNSYQEEDDPERS